MMNRDDQILALFRTIVESSDDAIVTKTLDGVVTSWNPGAERIFGYGSAEMIGQHINTLQKLGSAGRPQAAWGWTT